MADPVLQSPTNPHFFQPLLPGFHSHLNIPVAFFTDHLQGRNKNKTAKLRSDASDTTWEVEIEDGRSLTGGWKEFVTAHDLRVGDVLVFRHEGDSVFHVTPLGPSCCEIEYTPAHNIDDDSGDHHEDNIASQIEPRKKRTKKNPQREEEEDYSSDHSCFVATVSVSGIRDDRLYLPAGFVRSNGLSNTNCKIVLLNLTGRQWNLSLIHHKSGMRSLLTHGWRSFCRDNGMMTRGRYTFKLVRNSGTPVIRLCQADYNPCKPDTSCFVGSLTPSSIRDDALHLPKWYVRSNGLKEKMNEVVLMNENGERWDLVMRHNTRSSIITRGWNSFCQANEIKGGDSFKFKLVGDGEKLVLCLCSEESKRDAKEVECSEGNEVTSISTDDDSSGEESSETEEECEEKSRDEISVEEESEEESIEDKCLNVEKCKCCLRGEAKNRFVTLTITPYCVKSNKMRLPLGFTEGNGITKPGVIALLGQDGAKWMVKYARENRRGRMRLGGEWKGFCKAHGVKLEESFVLELIREKHATPVLKFHKKA
ncbi:unnamed protein product [Microthlaspi erraticum]|uniref:TF-B3 domain-containing protein n=1 Tax=Microthlaspi erraticum TaxID=1685480 RepID=A0A6D2HP13_9BRAS|nr:unnamed protein product [Microthlaspi erraticum]